MDGMGSEKIECFQAFGGSFPPKRDSTLRYRHVSTELTPETYRNQNLLDSFCPKMSVLKMKTPEFLDFLAKNELLFSFGK